MVEYLTQKQISKFPEYVDKWVKIGLSTERISFYQVKRIVNNLYKEILGYNENPIIILMDSPISAWYATLFCNHIFNNNKNIIQKNIMLFNKWNSYIELGDIKEITDSLIDIIETYISILENEFESIKQSIVNKSNNTNLTNEYNFTNIALVVAW